MSAASNLRAKSTRESISTTTQQYRIMQRHLDPYRITLPLKHPCSPHESSREATRWLNRSIRLSGTNPTNPNAEVKKCDVQYTWTNLQEKRIITFLEATRIQAAYVYRAIKDAGIRLALHTLSEDIRDDCCGHAGWKYDD